MKHGSNKNRKLIEIEKAENKDFTLWYLNVIAKTGLVAWVFYLFLQRAWAGEDAYIFFRYVDNFITGHGLVFNLGERVEGYTAPLWVFVLSLIRWMTGYQLRPIAIIFGLILSTLSIALLIYSEHSKELFFPLTLVLLVTNSAFRDFATSGFETSLTYLLLVLVLICIKRQMQFSRPLLVGVLLSLLVLNRPESLLILFFVFSVSILKSLKTRNWRSFGLLILPPVILLGGVELFRAGYFGALLPNTFYAKKGGSFYILQGFNYLYDFYLSYPFTVIIFSIITVFTLYKREYRKKFGPLFFIPVLLTGYVLYAGGDYMHGRSLLMAFVSWAFALIGPIEIALQELFLHKKITTVTKQLICFAVLFITGWVGLRQVSYTVKTQHAVYNIEDERSRFGYYVDPDHIKEYIALPITNELGWTERGLYYRELSAKLGLQISVVNANIGEFGYAAGPNVSIMGGVLVDPYLARIPIIKRGKIGHENDPDLPYVFSRHPTFAYTPFKYWNENAHFKWSDSNYAYALVGDSNDSYTPIFDLSNPEFLKRFSILSGHDIKAEIDLAQRKFIDGLTQNNLKNYDFDVNTYLGFLKVYWYPYASVQDRATFDSKTTILGWKNGASVYEKSNSSAVWDHVTKPLNLNQFMLNIEYSIENK